MGIDTIYFFVTVLRALAFCRLVVTFSFQRSPSSLYVGGYLQFPEVTQSPEAYHSTLPYELFQHAASFIGLLRRVSISTIPKIVCMCSVDQFCLTLFDPMGSTHQAPPCMGFSRQEYWSGVPLPSPTEKLVTLLLANGGKIAGQGFEYRPFWLHGSGSI